MHSVGPQQVCIFFLISKSETKIKNKPFSSNSSMEINTSHSVALSLPPLKPLTSPYLSFLIHSWTLATSPSVFGPDVLLDWPTPSEFPLQI